MATIEKVEGAGYCFICLLATGSEAAYAEHVLTGGHLEMENYTAYVTETGLADPTMEAKLTKNWRGE